MTVRDATVTQVPPLPGSGQPPETRVVYTIGHSTRDLDDFIALLEREHIEHVADVRSFPGSRRYPQFGREALAASLSERGIHYSHHRALGGRRRALPDSPNGGWRNESFRGYADYMSTPEFAAALDDLMALAARERTAIMCAEAVPWRCHRSMIADALVARGAQVRHILDARTEPHRLTSFAIVKDGVPHYPPVQTEL
ncbi:MAG TPA: DUF488 domain-containing protein [Gemmatimonadaceae bacterium]|nr:DUF488 domain-containing protein [Gemmatimonadaceae bacterium]